LELDYRSSTHLFLAFYDSDGRGIDAPYFFESSFWKDSDPVSGLGGWGDPNADFSVPDGAFNAMMLAYPSPHILRRQFALQPFNLSYPLYPEPLKFSNSTFSAAEVEAILETPSKRFKSFQARLDPPEVRAWIR
jgi:tyrosinase